MIKKKHKSYFLNFLKKNKLKKIYKILNKNIIDYDQLKNMVLSYILPKIETIDRSESNIAIVNLRSYQN